MVQKEPTIGDVLQELSSQYEGIVADRVVYDRVLERRPSRAKDPYASIRNQLRFNAPRVGWVWLGDNELMPLHAVLRGLRFRLIPTDEERAGQAMLRSSLRPFVPYGQGDIRIEDAHGHALPVAERGLTYTDGPFGAFTLAAVQPGDWFQQTSFRAGDSILVTITDVAPLTLRFEHEPASHFSADDVIAQERALLDELAARVQRAGRDMVSAEDGVLVIYARAPWRTEYPGRPWQHLVAADRRLRLLDEGLIVDHAFRSPLDMIFGDDRDEQYWEANDAELLEAITALQAELLASRRDAVERGVWDGMAPRVSTARTIFNMQDGTTETIYFGAVDAAQDYSAVIEAHVARGDYADMAWDDDEDDLDDWDAFDLDDDVFDEIEDIEDLEAFLAENPEFVDAARQIVELLSSEEIEQMRAAENPDAALPILTEHITDMLRHHPELLDTRVRATDAQDHHGHRNGHSAPHNGTSETHDMMLDTWLTAEDEDVLEDEDEVDVESALERSNELMERFYQHQREQGKSEATAAHRTRDLWVYADFLANYYGRSLEAGDYATLDECLFFYYPRKVLNSSARSVRDLCTSVKQFYGFLKARDQLADDGFAVAIWQRRQQAARVLELYDRLDSDSPQFGRLFAHLFAPYTA